MSPVILHTSDLHVGVETQNLNLLSLATSQLQPDIVVIAGDVFDNNRIEPSKIVDALDQMNALACPVVLLPGNHDSLGPHSVYSHVDPERMPNLAVLGLDGVDFMVFEDHDLEICGTPHRGYGDQAPISDPGARRARWRVMLAHGHWARGPQDARRGYAFSHEDVNRIDTDYLALGHWDIPTQVTGTSAPAYYSGAPTQNGTVNLIRFQTSGPPEVEIVQVGPPAFVED